MLQLPIHHFWILNLLAAYESTLYTNLCWNPNPIPRPHTPKLLLHNNRRDCLIFYKENGRWVHCVKSFISTENVLIGEGTWILILCKRNFWHTLLGFIILMWIIDSCLGRHHLTSKISSFFTSDPAGSSNFSPLISTVAFKDALCFVHPEWWPSRDGAAIVRYTPDGWQNKHFSPCLARRK